MANERTDGERDVLSSLPHSRPARRSARRPSAGERSSERSGPRQPVAAEPSGAGKAAAASRARRRVPPAGYATPDEPQGSAGAGELLSGAVRAAGEVAQLGADVGRRMVCGALGRLTRR